MGPTLKSVAVIVVCMAMISVSQGQGKKDVKVVKQKNENRVNVYIGKKLFTSFIFPDSLEKPVLYPVYAANGTIVTRGYPLAPRPNEPTDHPHHIGVWFNFENVNGLDFWNNSFAIPAEKKHLYGWIRTDSILETKNGSKGVLTYRANWINQQKEQLLEETTRFTFSGEGQQRIIDRETVLKAKMPVTFKDAKDGMLAIRLARELQMPADKPQTFTDDKGNVTTVNKKEDESATGNYLTSEGKQGDDAWSSRAKWCKVYGKIGDDSVSVVVMDHPQNPNYPTFWHARGYGLFAANPLGENIFTKGTSAKNLQLKPGESVTFRYRILIDNGKKTVSAEKIEKIAEEFGK